jgi:hypothetical protein
MILPSASAKIGHCRRSREEAPAHGLRQEGAPRSGRRSHLQQSMRSSIYWTSWQKGIRLTQKVSMRQPGIALLDPPPRKKESARARAFMENNWSTRVHQTLMPCIRIRYRILKLSWRHMSDLYSALGGVTDPRTQGLSLYERTIGRLKFGIDAPTGAGAECAGRAERRAGNANGPDESRRRRPALCWVLRRLRAGQRRPEG